MKGRSNTMDKDKEEPKTDKEEEFDWLFGLGDELTTDEIVDIEELLEDDF